MDEAEGDVSACIRQVRQGDEQAARWLLQHLYPLVIKVVRGHLPRRMSEEDLAQVIFMKIFSNIHQYSGTVPLSHWVSRIAVNTCLNHLSAERVRPELRWSELSESEQRVLESLAATSAELDPSHNVASRELVKKLLEKLRPDDRLLVQLLHMEGRSVQEISKMTGWSVPVIKVRAFRARHKLRKHLDHLTKENRV